jgi:hypothetical protein
METSSATGLLFETWLYAYMSRRSGTEDHCFDLHAIDYNVFPFFPFIMDILDQ